MTPMDRLRYGSAHPTPDVEAAPSVEATGASADPRSGRSLNLLGLRVGIDRNPGSVVKWTRRTIVMGSAAALVMSGGVAYAFWSSTGAGTGTANASQFQAVTANVTTVSSSATTLYPGSGATPIIINIHNPNAFTVKVTGVTLTDGQVPSGVSGAKDSTACTAAASAVTLIGSASVTGLTGTIPGNSDGTVTVPGGVKMASSSAEGCEGASFTFTTGIAVTATTN